MWYSQWAYLEQVYSKVNSCNLKEFSINFLKSLCECLIVISWNQWFMKIGMLIQKWYPPNELYFWTVEIVFWTSGASWCSVLLTFSKKSDTNFFLLNNRKHLNDSKVSISKNCSMNHGLQKMFLLNRVIIVKID